VPAPPPQRPERIGWIASRRDSVSPWSGNSARPAPIGARRPCAARVAVPSRRRPSARPANASRYAKARAPRAGRARRPPPASHAAERPAKRASPRPGARAGARRRRPAPRACATGRAITARVGERSEMPMPRQARARARRVRGRHDQRPSRREHHGKRVGADTVEARAGNRGSQAMSSPNASAALRRAPRPPPGSRRPGWERRGRLDANDSMR